MCAPSMPLLLEPSTRLSRVAPQDDCLVTSTSVMPCFLKKPFSSATKSGAASVSAMKPSLAGFVSSAVPCARNGVNPPIAPRAAPCACNALSRRRQHLGHREHGLRDVDHAPLLVHCHLAQRAVGLFFAG